MDSSFHLISISGPPAAGTSTLGELIANELDYKLVSGGYIFRQIAEERDLTLDELTTLSEKDDSIDKELDQRLKQKISTFTPDSIEEDGLIVESRLAGWHVNNTNPETKPFTIYLTAPRDIRSARIDGRTETTQELKRREESEQKRYQQYYGIDVTDTSIYDLTLDTSEHTITESKEKIFSRLQNKSN